MEENKKYITQLSASDLRELSALTNLVQGDGIYIKKENGRIEIGIDRDKLRALMGVI